MNWCSFWLCHSKKLHLPKFFFLLSDFCLLILSWEGGREQIEVYQWLKLRNIYMQSGFPNRCQVITVSWLLKNELKKSHQMKEIAMHVVKTNRSEANWDTSLIYKMLSHWWKELAKWLKKWTLLHIGAPYSSCLYKQASTLRQNVRTLKN